MSDPLSRAGQAPGSFGLKGSAGLQIKPPKKYGLQKPVRAPAAAAVFRPVEDELDEAQETVGMAAMRQSRAAQSAAAAAQKAAMAKDASVYDYDGVYDEMSRAKERQRSALGPAGGVGGAAKAPERARYISSIMEAHKEREIQNDKIFERKMVKEAEEEVCTSNPVAPFTNTNKPSV